MRNKNKLLSVLAAGALSLTAVALCSMQPVSAYAETTTVESKFTIQEGASVRFATDKETQENKAVSGIRFAAYITESYYQTLTQTTYPTATEITLQSTVSKVVEEGESAPAPFTYSWDLKNPITFNEKGVATFYHTLNFNSLTGENLKVANAFDLEADFWIEVKTGSEATPIKIEADNAEEVSTVRSMRQVAYTAYTTPKAGEEANPNFQNEKLKTYFSLGATSNAVYDMDVANTAILETAPQSVEADKVYLVDQESFALSNVSDKTLASDTGVFTAEEGRANTTKTLVYFDENNVAYPTKTRFVTKIIDNEEELRKALQWDVTTTTTVSPWGYHLLAGDVTVAAPLTTSAARTIKYGTLDGDGHKLTVSSADTFRGLFGTALTKVVIKNMQIDLTRDFGDGVENTNYQVVLAHNADKDSSFVNLNVNIKRAVGDTTVSRVYSNKYYLNLTAQGVAWAQNLVVNVADGVLQRADANDGYPFIVQGFNKSSSWYVFSSEITGCSTSCKLYSSVSNAFSAGEQFVDLEMRGYWTVDRTNGTLGFGKNAYLTKINALNAKLEENGIRNVSFLGDSISTFSGWSNSTSYNTTIGDNAVYYTTSKAPGITNVNDVWWKKVLNTTNTNLCVDNAYSGDRVTTRGVSRALQLHRDVDGTLNPDMIFVYLGVNDFNHSVSVDTFKETYDTMIKGMKEKYSNAKIYVGTIMPNARRVAPTVLDQFNAAIREIAQKYGVGLIDFYNDSGITADNMSTYYWETTASQRLHPNAVGMDMMAKTVLDKLIEDYMG